MVSLSNAAQSSSQPIRVKTPNGSASDTADINHQAIASELEWLSAFIQFRLSAYFEQGEDHDTKLKAPSPPALEKTSVYGRLIDKTDLSIGARLILALALAPYFQPTILDPFFLLNPSINRPFSEFGGQINPGHGAFLPTGETAIFLISGSDTQSRIESLELFDPAHVLHTEFSISLTPPPAGRHRLSGTLQISSAQVTRLRTDEEEKPHYSMNFPAHRLETKLQWDDLVLAPELLDQVEHIISWIEHEDKILDDWQFNKMLAPGYRALFYGPSGTGKTLTVSLLGKHTGLDVYRVDLSMMVSKFIGETEKNLANVFDQAAHKNWILFFDEADALFGKRTSTSSSNDKYANQEVAYLLQRIETCPTVVILATNLKTNIDDAFYRRFQSIIGFTKPNATQRLHLWQKALRDTAPLGKDVDLDSIAAKYELVGGAIVNIVRHAAVNALRHKRDHLSQADLLAGIAREMHKEGLTL